MEELVQPICQSAPVRMRSIADQASDAKLIASMIGCGSRLNGFSARRLNHLAQTASTHRRVDPGN